VWRFFDLNIETIIQDNQANEFDTLWVNPLSLRTNSKKGDKIKISELTIDNRIKKEKS
jgi:hypothetical protein